MNRPPAASTGGYWRWAVPAASVILAVNSLRLAEMIRGLAQVRPLLLVMLTVFPMLVGFSSARVRAAVWRDKMMKLLLLYAGWAAAGVPFALWVANSVGTLRQMAYGAISVVALLLCPKDRQALNALARNFAVIVTGTAALSYLGGQMTGGRLASLGGLDPNDLALLVVTALPFNVALAIRGTLASRLLGVVGCVVAAVTVIATGSRGGMIAAALALATLAISLNWKRSLAMIALVSVLLPIGVANAPESFTRQFDSLFSLEDDYNATADYGRLSTWKRGIGYTLDHPIFGVGMGNFGSAEGERMEREGITGQPWVTAHNAYVQAFAEFGIPGGLIFLSMLGYAAQTANTLRRKPYARPEYLASIVGFSAAAFFLSFAYHWVTFGVLALFAHAGATLRSQQPAKGTSLPRSTQVRVQHHRYTFQR